MNDYRLPIIILKGVTSEKNNGNQLNTNLERLSMQRKSIEHKSINDFRYKAEILITYDSSK